MNWKLIIGWLLLLLCSNDWLLGQDQKEADSLINVLNQGKEFPDSTRYALLYFISSYSSSPDDKLQYAQSLYEVSEGADQYYFVKACQLKGVAYRLKGNVEKSLESLFQSAEKANEFNEYMLAAEAYLEIATTYTANSDLNNALRYEGKGVEIIRREAGRSQLLAISLLNIGFSHYSLGKLDSALLLYQEAGPIFDEIELSIGSAYVIGNSALVYWKQGRLEEAERGMLQAIELLKPLGDQYGIADYHNQLGNLYFEQKAYPNSIFHTEKALIISKRLGLKEQIRDAMSLLSRLHKAQENYEEALHYQGQFIAYKDSIENTEQIKKIADLRTAFEVNIREKEIDLLEEREAINKTYIFIALILLLLSVATLLYFRQRFKNSQLVTERERKQHTDRIKDILSHQETKTLQSMVAGRENERKRLAKELHNHFGSLMATIKVNINGIEEEAIPNHGTLTKLIDQACTDIRNISHSLNMGIGENFGLVAALRELIEHLQDSDGLQVEFEASMCDGLLDSENEIVIYRLVQELISNVLKHAKATKLSVLLTCYDEENLVNILVQDNGKGFDVALTEVNADGIGLKSLRQIVAEHEGEISFDSNATSGTTVSIDFPIISETKMEK